MLQGLDERALGKGEARRRGRGPGGQGPGGGLDGGDIAGEGPPARGELGGEDQGLAALLLPAALGGGGGGVVGIVGVVGVVGVGVVGGGSVIGSFGGRGPRLDGVVDLFVIVFIVVDDFLRARA